MTAMCCIQSWVKGHFTDISIHPSINSIPIHTCFYLRFTKARHMWIASGRNSCTSELKATKRGGIEAVTKRHSPFLGSGVFQRNSWLRGFRIDLVVMAVKDICDGNTRTLYLYNFYTICLYLFEQFIELDQAIMLAIPVCKLNSKTSHQHFPHRSPHRVDRSHVAVLQHDRLPVRAIVGRTPVYIVHP